MVISNDRVCDLDTGRAKFLTELLGLSDGVKKYGKPLTKAGEVYENFSSLEEYSESILDESPNLFRENEREGYLDGLRRAIKDGENSPDAAIREDARRAKQNMEDDGTWNEGNTSCDDHSDANPDKPTDSRTVRAEIQDPLVIDLDGDGIELVSLENSDVQFDLDGNGFAQATGWVSADDGFLVRDVNNDGVIHDISEMFGDTNGFADGFLNLASLDENQDGVIDSSDSVFSELEIWRDLNQDGQADEGELFSLQEVGLQSISLATTDANQSVEGHWVPKTSTVTFTDGSESEVAAVFFEQNSFISTPVLDPDFENDAEAQLMPLLLGTGSVASTDVALTLDPSLKAQAQSLLDLLEAGDIASYHTAFDAFFLDWTGGNEADANGRGAYVDGQKLAAIEAIYGQQYTVTTRGFFGGVIEVSHTPDEDAGPEMNALYQTIRDWLSIRFIAQSAISSTILNNPDETDWETQLGNFLDHPMHRLTYLVDLEAENETQLQGSLEGFLSNLYIMVDSNAISDADAASIGHLATHDFGPTASQFIENVANAGGDAGLTLQDEFFARLLYSETHEFVVGSGDADSLSASADGPHFLYGYAGDDVITGGDGGDFIIGGLGVRRQGFWDRWRSDLRVSVAHLVGLIMRRICGEASAGFRWSFV